MGDTSGIPCLSNTTVLEVASKIIISAVILLFIVIAKVFLLHIYTRVFWSSSSYEARYILSWRRQQVTITHQQQQQRGPGLDQSTLNSLPIVSYCGDDINLNEVGGLECCAICLCELQKGEKVRFLPKCNHGFHLDCIDIWFKSHSSCPICRADLVIVEGGSDTDSAVLTPPISSGDNGEDHHDHGRGVGNTQSPVVVLSIRSIDVLLLWFTLMLLPYPSWLVSSFARWWLLVSQLGIRLLCQLLLAFSYYLKREGRS